MTPLEQLECIAVGVGIPYLVLAAGHVPSVVVHSIRQINARSRDSNGVCRSNFSSERS